MKYISSILLLLFAFVTPVHAVEYYVGDYDPDYAPYNLAETIEHIDYDQCEKAVADFDSSYERLLRTSTPITIGDIPDVDFALLREIYEEEFRACLQEYRAEKKQESIENCDFDVIETLSDNEVRKYQTEVNECEIQRALDNCDLNFIDNISSSKKVTHHEQIAECRNEAESDLDNDTKPEQIETTEAKKPQDIAVVETYVPESSQSSVVSRTETQAQTTERAENSATTTSDQITVSEEELNEMVQKKVAEKLNAQKQESESFLDRLVNFFTGWF